MRNNVGLRFAPLHPVIGAECLGVDIGEPFSPEIAEAIHEGMDRYAVLVFRRGTALTTEQQIRFTKSLGETEGLYRKIQAEKGVRLANPLLSDISNLDPSDKLLPPDDRKRLFNLGNRLWHSDSSYKKIPAKYSALCAHVIPPRGGETEFADMRAAYDALDDALKKRLDGLKVVYSYIRAYEAKMNEGSSSRKPLTEKQRAEVPDVVQPLIRTHPYTGRKIIYANPAHTFEIVGMPEKESQALLNELYAHITKPEFVYRHQWTAEDVLMWDNCVVQHNAVGDYALPQRRLMHTTRIKGTVPF